MILVQREFAVETRDEAEFERQSREGLWPTFLHFGAQMVAFGRWGFGGRGGVLVTNTVYADFDHWLATRAGEGAFYADARMMEEVKTLLPVFRTRGRLVTSSAARLYEIDDALSEPVTFHRRAGEPLAEAPRTYGRGSVVLERRYLCAPGGRESFLSLSRDAIWPWIEGQGARLLAVGRDMLASEHEITVFLAMPSLPAWYALESRDAGTEPPEEVARAIAERAERIQSTSAKLLLVRTDFGSKLD